MRYFVFIIILILSTTSIIDADTVVMKDKEGIKGLVVDEYVDRIILNTVDGEKSIFREDIEKIMYDTPEQNFMQLGRAYDAKGWYDKSAFYYKKAMEINPNYKEAREAYLASHAKMWQQEERMSKKELGRRRMMMDWGKNKSEKDLPLVKDKASLLKYTLGISLVEKDGVFIIDDVRPYSSAAKAGVKKGNILVAIWNKLVRHSKIEDIINELLGPKYSEVRVLVEKEILIPIGSNYKNLYKELGILLDFEYEGLIIKDVTPGGRGGSAGFKKGDFVVAVDKNITRYLSLDSVITVINSSRNNENIIFTVRRKINLRREGG